MLLLALLLLLFPRRVKELGNVVVLGKRGLKLGEQRDALLEAAGGQELAGFRETLQLPLLRLILQRGLANALGLRLAREFLLEIVQQREASLVLVSGEQLARLRKNFLFALLALLL